MQKVFDEAYEKEIVCLYMSLDLDTEQQRLAAVCRYEILDTPPDKAFDRVTAMAARLFNVPIAMISIVDQERIWLKSHYGLEMEQIGRDVGLCAPVILQDAVYSVVDACFDPRTLANPLVTGEFGIRFYAAAPLHTADNFNIGTICVVDFQPRSISEAEKNILEDLAAIVMNELELRRLARKTIELEAALKTQALQRERAEQMARTDALTGLLNRRMFEQDLEWYRSQASQHGSDAVVAIVDIDGFKTVNDLYGHQQGDLLLKAFGRAVQRYFRQEDMSYRFGGDEFAFLLPIKAGRHPEPVYTSLRSRMAMVVEEISAAGFEQVSISLGMATITEADYDPGAVVRLADTRMYMEKQKRQRPIANYLGNWNSFW